VVPLLTLTAAGLLPWTLWLTYSLPSRNITDHYDLAWVGFDVALLLAFAATTWFAVRSSQWLVPGWFIVFDVERFRQATILRYTGTVKRMLGDES
jgi:hypothetical protein